MNDAVIRVVDVDGTVKTTVLRPGDTLTIILGPGDGRVTGGDVFKPSVPIEVFHTTTAGGKIAVPPQELAKFAAELHGRPVMQVVDGVEVVVGRVDSVRVESGVVSGVVEATAIRCHDCGVRLSLWSDWSRDAEGRFHCEKCCEEARRSTCYCCGVRDADTAGSYSPDGQFMCTTCQRSETKQCSETGTGADSCWSADEMVRAKGVICPRCRATKSLGMHPMTGVVGVRCPGGCDD